MLDDGLKDIEAFIDGELSPADRERILKKIKSSKRLENHYRKLKLQKQLLIEWWKTKQKH